MRICESITHINLDLDISYMFSASHAIGFVCRPHDPNHW